MSCCGGGGCGGGGCGSGGCGSGGCGGGGCGKSGGGCGGCSGNGGSMCANCPRRRQPIGLVCLDRPALLKALDVLKDSQQYEIVGDEKLGMVLQTPGGSCNVAAELVEFTDAIDPMTGWTIEAAKRSPVLLPSVVHGKVAARGPCSDLFGALLVSQGSYPAFFALLPADAEGLHGLRAVPYPHLSPEEIAAHLEKGPAVWPPPGVILRLPSVVTGGFVLDPAADACEHVHKKPFVGTGRKPAVGNGLFLHVTVAQNQSLPYVRMAGVVTEVGELPAEGASDGSVGDSFFKECTCGKAHPREDILKELGTLHGQRIHGVVFLTKEYLGRLPELEGQWDVVLVADDHKQFIWQIDHLEPHPRDQWVPRTEY